MKIGLVLVLETSPHTRGEPKRLLIKFKKRGNIPAYAGRTGRFIAIGLGSQKHPRIRGENFTLWLLRLFV